MNLPTTNPIRTRRASASVLHAHNITRQYQMGAVTVMALKGVNLTVNRGEFAAIMGPSGSGKSTLLYLLGGLDRPTGGEVILAGEKLSTLSDDALSVIRRRRIGFIFQAFNLLPTLTAAENVLLPVLIDGRQPAPYQEKLQSLFQLVRLGERHHHKPDELSGGQQQRVAIARALVTDPEIILADEPTGNLDSKSGGIVLGMLRRACEDMQATIVMVTHDPRAASFADRVVFLKDGRIVNEIRNRRDGQDVVRVAQTLAALEETTP